MPTAPRSRCLVCRTGWAVTRGRCADCYTPWEQRSQHGQKITRRQRERFRTAVLRRDPVCRACGEADATEADHVIPVADGGSLHDVANGQGLCHACHDIKTRAENASRNTRRARRSP
ncbi:HNH endonuclease signature motif containing protein [Nocardioides pini]|uniref:HNH endonuclease signature motif containing protein n=1 Tax=Nocardioides pini TaxID=2975053 RepID=UPI003899278A